MSAPNFDSYSARLMAITIAPAHMSYESFTEAKTTTAKIGKGILTILATVFSAVFFVIALPITFGASLIDGIRLASDRATTKELVCSTGHAFAGECNS